MRPGALDLADLLSDVDVPDSSVPGLDFNVKDNSDSSGIFDEKKRKGWNHDAEPRCDFADKKIKVSFRNPEFGIISRWNRSVYGRTLSDIKSDKSLVDFFAKELVALIKKILGCSLDKGDWAVVTAPKRRHKDFNFASAVAKGIASGLNINFYEDLVSCNSRQRVNAVFNLEYEPPSERNLIVFDDIVTSGSTMIALRNVFINSGYNMAFFTAINNKM